MVIPQRSTKTGLLWEGRGDRMSNASKRSHRNGAFRQDVDAVSTSYGSDHTYKSQETLPACLGAVWGQFKIPHMASSSAEMFFLVGKNKLVGGFLPH